MGMNLEKLKNLAKDQIPQEAKNLTSSDVAFLIETLAEKDDTVRYSAFLLLQAHSRLSPLVYPFWSVLEEKLGSDNSYQRSLGLMLIAENVRWDSEGKFAKTINQYLKCCTDEKFITARQAILGLANVAKATDAYNVKIQQYLSGLDLAKYKENQQKLLKKDAASILKIIS
jgi:hypothetical protein